jgi:hypothetical protein
LKALVAAGHKPTTEDITIIVFAQKPVNGETGTDMVEPYGSTSYDSVHDQLRFKDERIR